MKYLISFLLFAALLHSALTQESSCVSLVPGQITPTNPMQLFFGANDSPDGELECCSWGSNNSDFNANDRGYSFMKNVGNFFINEVPLMGGKNYSQAWYQTFVPTAHFLCESNSSALWGPSYPDFHNADFIAGAAFPHLETYVHYSAPSESSYMRHIVYVKNTGTARERVRLFGDWNTRDYGVDIAPLNDGRYMVPYFGQDGYLGWDGTDPFAGIEIVLSSIHARGAFNQHSSGTDMTAGKRSLDVTAQVQADMSNLLLSISDYTELEPGASWAAMFVVGFGHNRTQIRNTAAYIDSEPLELFHGLNADQLALISNWGGCQVVLGPQVTVTIRAPARCSNGLSSDFTVSVDTSRDDFTASFMHLVVEVPRSTLQTDTILAVPNNLGTVTHQLWYNGCFIKETQFESCATAAAPGTATGPAVTSRASTSGAHVLICVALSIFVLF